MTDNPDLFIDDAIDDSLLKWLQVGVKSLFRRK